MRRANGRRVGVHALILSYAKRPPGRIGRRFWLRGGLGTATAPQTKRKFNVVSLMLRLMAPEPPQDAGGMLQALARIGDPSCHSSRFRNHFNSWRHSATLKGRPVPSWRVAVESISATLAHGPGACPHGPRVGVYRRREADRVSKACWGRPSSWRSSRPRGLMQGPRLSAGRRLQTCRGPSDDLTAENKQRRERLLTAQQT
jgi:hypothetical protein